LTIEDHSIVGGFGSAVLEMFQEASFFPADILRLGIPDIFAPHGSQSILRNLFGIDAEGIESAAYNLVKSRNGKIVHAFGHAARR
jgi:1-deoxy-D-xylulose-5-phosphate synthase